jgi:hypothetical protein
MHKFGGGGRFNSVDNENSSAWGVTFDRDVDRDAYARHHYYQKVNGLPTFDVFASSMNASKSEASNVIYELLRFLGIRDVDPKTALRMAISCPDLSKSLLKEIRTEIPF